MNLFLLNLLGHKLIKFGIYGCSWISTSIRKKFVGIRTIILLKNWEGIRVLGTVFVYFFDLLKRSNNTFLNNTFEYFDFGIHDIPWNTLEYFGIRPLGILCGIPIEYLIKKWNTKG